MNITETLKNFSDYLYEAEKSPITVSKYVRDVRCFLEYLGGAPLDKPAVLSYKNGLISSGRYTTGSINTIIASVNSYLKFIGRGDLCVKSLRTQRKIYYPEEKELTKQDYLKLLRAAEKFPRLKMIMETICATGIRVSELRYFTVGAVKRGEIEVLCKNKTRVILIPSKLKKMLAEYIKSRKISDGPVFVTRTGRPVDRRSIWAEMKALCSSAGVPPSKVFPHNLRRLFARTFYRVGRDIARLADVLGHSSINTTRIYIMTSGAEHRRRLENLGLIT